MTGAGVAGIAGNGAGYSITPPFTYDATNGGDAILIESGAIGVGKLQGPGHGSDRILLDARQR